MKHNKIFCVLILAIILALLVVAIPATPALAQVMVASPSSGIPGTTVTVTGSGFITYATQWVHIFFSSVWIAAPLVNAQGTFSATFSIPDGATIGTALITVQHSSSAYSPAYQIAATFFTVTPQTTIVTSPSLASVGQTVTVIGTGFTAGMNVTITFDAVSAGTATADVNGDFTTTFTVPESYRGSHTVKATDAANRFDTADFTTMQSITLTPTSGAVGDTIMVSGTGFRASQSMIITYDNATVATSPASVTTDNRGSFSASFSIPISASGTHTVEASDGTYTGSASVAATASFSLGQTTGHVGDEVAVSGTGFTANQAVTITFATVQVKIITTDATGSFSGKFAVPASVSGTYNVVASDGVNTGSTDFTILISTSLSQTTGNVGSEITVSGVGFTGTVIIKYDEIEVATATADATGAFSAIFAIPASAGGDHIVTASDGVNTIQTTFVMESAAPLAPEPLLPEADSKAEAEAYFDWEDVSDPSGVTYTLQIATDENFTEGSIVLEKKGLTESEYTITKKEKLESTKKEAPYYWRVKAIDGAANESAWSTLGSFYVGFVLALPDWAKYTLMGVVAVLIGLLGFWLGRRTAYYSY